MKCLVIYSCFLLIVVTIGVNAEKKLKIDTRELVNINGTLYYIGPEVNHYSPAQAVALCNDVGMRLISLQTEEKNTAVYNYLNATGHGSLFWTSGVRYEDNIWIWSGTGELFTYTNWGIDEPNVPISEPDAHLYVAAFHSKEWWDDTSFFELNVICEEK